MCAWTAPRDWSAGETVTELMMDTHVRDNLLHIAGSVGFTATPSTSVGIQPAAGYFAGANLRNYHIEGGRTCVATTGGLQLSFNNAYASTAPYVTLTELTTDYTGGGYMAMVTAVSTTGFTIVTPYSSRATWLWLAWGSDT